MISLARMLLFAVCIPASVAGCAADRAAVEQFGGMRAVLREGKSEPRIALTRALSKPHAFGVGALAGLSGEVTILDGQAVVSRVRDGVLRSGPPEPDDQATLLTLTSVARWRTAPLDHAAADAELEQAVRDIAAASGIDVAQPFPFVIEGDLSALDVHVINGECPMAGGGESGPTAPWRLRLGAPAKARLVGIYANGREGEMTHHGSSAHMHVLIERDGHVITGHVESARVDAGAAVRVPG